MEGLLYQYNPWGEGEFEVQGARPREAQLDRIESLISENRVVFLTGLRRVGKTTLVKLLASRLIHRGAAPETILSVSMDDFLLRGVSVVEIVSAFRRIHRFSVDRPVFLLFDEITYKPDYPQQLKNLVDQGKAAILATSSSRSLLRDQRAS